MFRKTTQRPTEKTVRPPHPFFIGSWPEPVFCGGIFSSFFISHKIVALVSLPQKVSSEGRWENPSWLCQDITGTLGIPGP
uniref:Uncharacterized protein n=1 Tax=Rhinolophus ferrumequinum TaxID=59479 RepID=A0A671EWA2_RHIFE